MKGGLEVVKRQVSGTNLSLHRIAVALLIRSTASLVIADHLLKGIPGTDLAARIKAVNPCIPVLMISGTEPESLEHIDCFLAKGEPIPRMLRMVRDLIERSQT